MKKVIAKTAGLKLPVLALVGVVFAVITVFGRAAEPKTAPLVLPPTSSFASAVAGIGVVEPQSEVISIASDLSGVVRTVHVKVGDKVAAGDPLFTLDERDINAQIRALEAAVNVAKALSDDAAAQFAIVNSIKDKRAVARDDFNRRKFAAAATAARVTEAEAQLELARTTKDRLTVRAPISATVLSVDIRPGEFASAATAAVPLMRLGDVQTLHVRVEIDEENAARVLPTAEAKAFQRGKTDSAIPLTFVRFEPLVRPKQNLAVAGQRVDTRVLQVIYALTAGDHQPFVGEQMDVFIAEGRAP